MQELPKSITLDGVEYPLSRFTNGVEHIVNVIFQWKEDLKKEILAMSKTEAAIQLAEQQLTGLVRAQLAEQAEQAAQLKEGEKPVVEAASDEAA
jgi:hypothetical protein